METSEQGVDGPPLHLYALNANDPKSELIDRSNIDPIDIEQISQLMGALGRLRNAEQDIALASQQYMKLGKNEMKALHFLMVAGNRDTLITPSAIAHHLNISTASTTKLLDRLEGGNHIIRAAHPTDRRALTISVTPETHQSAMDTVGRQQAKRFGAASRLTREERTVVIRFLNEMSDDLSVLDGDWAHGHNTDTNDTLHSHDPADAHTDD